MRACGAEAFLAPMVVPARRERKEATSARIVLVLPVPGGPLIREKPKVRMAATTARA